MSSITELATERVKQLTPYLSARRIGGKGHNFLNANEAPKKPMLITQALPKKTFWFHAAVTNPSDFWSAPSVNRAGTQSLSALRPTACIQSVPTPPV